MKANAEIEKDVMAVIQKYTDAYANQDLEGILALFVPDPDVVAIGTGADEERIGLSEIKRQILRDWAQSDSLSIEMGWHSVSASGNTAWVALNCVMNVKAARQFLRLPMRWSLVLEKRDHHWLIVQFHCSMANDAQEAGQSFPV